MARTTVEIDGLKRLGKELDELPEKLRAAFKDAARESAEAVKDETETTVAVDTGHLRTHVRVRFDDGGLTPVIGWFDDDSYYAQFVEFGTESIEARPSLVPALEHERPRLPARVRAHVRRVG
jgi:HK97 gp10 family phage protein